MGATVAPESPPAKPEAMPWTTEPDLRLIRAPNPSPMTEAGTNSWLISDRGQAMLIDPGPALPAHHAALMQALAGLELVAILVTHSHLDHSAGVPALAQATGAPVLALGPHFTGQSPRMAALQAQGLTAGAEGIDHDFRPDQGLTDGQPLRLGRFEVDAIRTPGHTANHMAFACGGLLFSGDHAMGWASSLISPPDGDMGDYMASLDRLAARDWRRMLPGHGAPVEDPAARLAELTRHRRQREAEILAAVTDTPADAATIARAVYRDTPAALMGAATRNVLAHLVDLHDRSLIRTEPPLTATAGFTR